MKTPNRSPNPPKLDYAGRTSGHDLTLQETLSSISIRPEGGGEGYQAWFNGDRRRYARGKTMTEAVGRLIMDRCDWKDYVPVGNDCQLG